MTISHEETARQSAEFNRWRHRNLTRQPGDTSKAGSGKGAYTRRVEVDAKLADMSDERFIAEMMGFPG